MILALNGLPRTGKDTFADYLTSNKRYNYDSYAFALPIKKLLCEMFGWDIASFDRDDKDEIDDFWGLSKRQAMEYFGTDVCRGSLRERFPLFEERTGNNIWVRRFEKFMSTTDKNIVVSDLRFKVEYDYLRKLNAIIIRVERPNYPNLDESKCYDMPIMNYDYTIYNDDEGNIEKYHDSIRLLLEHITFADFKK